jgi:folylpolyglutamate synthase/dihydropteroate synthase
MQTILRSDGPPMYVDDNLGLKNCGGVEAGVGLRLIGEHQISNASTAVAAARILRRERFPRISSEAVVSGLESAFMPGRFQVHHPT